MTSRSFLAFDIGAESGRAIAGAFDGSALRLSEVHRFPNKPVRVGPHLYWNPLALWDEIQAGLRKAAAQCGTIAGAGVDTWGVDFALLDARDELVGNPHHYRDARTDGMVGEACACVGRERIFESTGIQFMQINTLYQLLAMARAGAPALEIARTFLMMPDLLHFWLSGYKACEFSNATTTQCYDPRAGDWARDLLASLGIPTHFLPAVIQPGTDLGPLSPALVRALDTGGLEATRVIAPATHDTGSAVAGVPASAERYAYISSGTWSLLGAVVPRPVITPQALQFNFTNEGGVGGTFRLLKNIMGMWLVQECRRKWASPAGDLIPYSELFAMAEQAPALGPLVDPDDATFLHPDDMPAAIADYCRRTGQPVPDGRGAMVRCILESLALKYRYTLNQLQALLGYSVEVIHVVGGGAQNALLCQFTADACGVPVMAGPVEATAIGNLLVQMVTFGELASMDDARQVIRRSFPLVTYEPRAVARWDDAYARFEAMLCRA
ncbi:MAG: rhamnulokinase family protein [Anaerolineae bacterium]|nr:rhamnulokinase [Candidatus Roseilinea sp.]MDW8449648.1 rhamnulokinase family protein [Anaerolineae bacterium]